MEAAALGFRYGLGLIFLSSSIPKLVAPGDFVIAVRNYRLLRSPYSDLVGKWLPWLELTLAFALLVGVATTLAAGLAGAALLAFAGAVSVNLARGRRIECGCYSTVSPRSIGWGLVLRDVALAIAAAFLVFAPPTPFSLSTLWSDENVALSSDEAGAVVLMAATVVLAEDLIIAALRVRRAVAMTAPLDETR
jgi:Methylamine utilisation protein MauE